MQPTDMKLRENEVFFDIWDAAPRKERLANGDLKRAKIPLQKFKQKIWANAQETRESQ